MVSDQKSTPVGALELKAAIYRKIGHRRTENYFDLLKRFFSFKLKKYEFDKSCMRIIGRDNISLHNQLIRTILKNSYVGKVPLSRAKNVAVVASHNVKVSNCLPVNSRSLVNRDQKFRDRPSPLGPLGESQQSETELLSLGSRPPIKLYRWKMGKKSSRRLEALAFKQTFELPDARSLMIILERKLDMEGLKISVDCVNVLNISLDCYLKRLIEPCIGLAGSRHFGVVMESNPCILGGDWAVLREKAYAQAFEE
ncbi:hypothetical protein AgCh_001304 [Apium graveolens]